MILFRYSSVVDKVGIFKGKKRKNNYERKDLEGTCERKRVDAYKR